MFQKTCGATCVGSCVEPDHEKDEIIVKSQPEQPSKYNDLDFKDFDIVRATQVSSIQFNNPITAN
jgi:hypothetical protein